MPFKSEAQRNFMFAKHPEIAKKWADEMKSKGQSLTDKALPQKASPWMNMKGSK